MHVRRYDAALNELGLRLRWLHFLWAAHIHDALRVGGGLQPLPVHVSLMRKVIAPSSPRPPNASRVTAHRLA